MSHVISMYHLGDPRQKAVSYLSKIILCLVVQHSNLVVRAKQNIHSVTPAKQKEITLYQPFL